MWSAFTINLILIDFSSLALFRQTCHQLLKDPVLLKIYQSRWRTHELLKKVVFSAKPFFPKTVINEDHNSESKKYGQCSRYFSEIRAGCKYIGRFVFNGLWTAQYCLPNTWYEYMLSPIKTLRVPEGYYPKYVGDFYSQYFTRDDLNLSLYNGALTWDWKSFNNYENLSKIQTQFWQLHRIVCTQSPVDFFTSNQKFF